MKIRQWIARSLLLVGVGALGIWVGSNATNAIWQCWENWVFDREIRGELATVTAYVAEKKEHVIGAARAWWGLPSKPFVATRGRIPSASRSTIGTNGLVGRLSIPRLHVSAIVREGVGEDTLGLAVGHIPSTAFPGQTGNVGVAGHRDTLFRGLREIRADDLIRFETLDGNFVYQVGSTEIVKPQNVSVLKANQYSELTLVTCYPFTYVGSAPDRFIVKARQVSQGPSQQNQLAEVSRKIADKDTHQDSKRARLKTGAKQVREVTFNVSANHSRELAPGISLGVTETDVTDGRVNGWMWLMPDRRTIWLRNQGTADPVVFYGYQDGKRRELLITAITKSSVSGYLLLPKE